MEPSGSARVPECAYRRGRGPVPASTPPIDLPRAPTPSSAPAPSASTSPAPALSRAGRLGEDPSLTTGTSTTHGAPSPLPLGLCLPGRLGEDLSLTTGTRPRAWRTLRGQSGGGTPRRRHRTTCRARLRVTLGRCPTAYRPGATRDRSTPGDLPPEGVGDDLARPLARRGWRPSRARPVDHLVDRAGTPLVGRRARAGARSAGTTP